MDFRSLRVDAIYPDPDQPRRTFDESKIDELAASIRMDGLLQPIRVRPHPNRQDAFLIIAGERRWRAAQRVPLTEMTAIVVQQRHSEERVRAEQAVENLQREDMNAVEEAVCYRALMTAWNVSQAELARRLSKSTAHVSRVLAVLELDESTRQRIVRGEVSYVDALQERAQNQQAAERRGRATTSRRRSLPRGTVSTPFGTVKLKRGARLEQLVAHLRSMVEQVSDAA
jgi:ParB/RepB/Spo0J family partition protein